MAAVDWDLAQRVAARSAPKDPFADSYHYDSLAPDFEELTAIAEKQVAETTGLHSLAGPARARVTDRPGWVSANIASFQRLLRPITERLDERVSSTPFAPVARRVAGAEIGVLLGWMSGPGARPVRPARHRGRGARGPGHRVLRRAERPRPREALRLPAPRVPAVAGPARGHPPGAVHRHPVDARALPRARRVDGERGRHRPEAAPRLDRAGGGEHPQAATTRSTTAASRSCSPRPSSARCSRR